LSYLYPLAGFVIPTVLIGYGIVIRRSCIAGINDLTVGFATTIVVASLMYFLGFRSVLRDHRIAQPSGRRDDAAS
jgi:hypothetical protein